MSVAEAQSVSKSFGDFAAVDDVSFTLEAGTVMGLVGPNGAGKTTTIRMLLDIIRPDTGQVLLFGRRFADAHRALIGYLPEERGLYRDLRVLYTLEYLGALKGMERADARLRAGQVLERLGMADQRHKKVSELSRGMGQLIGLAVTILHRPRLLVLDEPFSGLDPVNVRLLKELLAELRGEGVATVLSTHQMDQVEELSDRVLMIDRGRVVLYGPLQELRRDAGRHVLIVEADWLPNRLPGVVEIKDRGSHHELHLAGEASAPQVLRSLVDEGVQVQRFQVEAPSLEEIFVRTVRGRRE